MFAIIFPIIIGVIYCIYRVFTAESDRKFEFGCGGCLGAIALILIVGVFLLMALSSLH